MNTAEGRIDESRGLTRIRISFRSSPTPLFADAPAVVGENSITAKIRRVRQPVAPARLVETISVARYQEMIRPTAPAGEFPKGDASKLIIVPKQAEPSAP